jgi:hypothetical protein
VAQIHIDVPVRSDDTTDISERLGKDCFKVGSVMKTITLLAVAAVILASATWCRPQCNRGTAVKKGNLTIVPIDRSKSLSERDAYDVKEFVDLRSNVDRSRLFGRNKKVHIDTPAYYAADVPYGKYLIKLQSRSASDSFGRYIDVCQPDETVEVPRELARVHVVPLLAGIRSVKAESTETFKVTKFKNEDGTEMSGMFKGGVAHQIPYGYYDLEFILGLGYVKREVHVFQPDVWVFSDSGGYYGDTDTSGPGNVVRGELKNIPANERPVFMIMSGVYFPYTINSVVSDTGDGSGSFSFVGDNPSGRFMLYTIGKSGILDAREFGIPRDSEIAIDLVHPSPPKIDEAP